MVATCTLFDKIKRARLFGIHIQGSVTTEWPDVQSRVSDTVKSLNKGIEGLLKDRGIQQVQGRARFVDAHTVEVQGVGNISGDSFLVCTGSRPARPAAFVFDGLAVSTSDDLLRWETLPSSLVIVGEGIIACELAFILRSLGVAVTMLGMEERPLPTQDKDISEVIAREFKKRKIAFHGGLCVEQLQLLPGGVAVMGPEGPVASAERALVCVGRIPNTRDMGLDCAAIHTGSRGQIEVDSYMRTSASDIYAAGDVTGRIMLAHAASAQARLAVDHILGLPTHTLDENAIPWAIFTSPEIGCVGLSEEAAVSRGYRVKCSRFDFRGLGKAQAIGELSGFVKIVAEAETGKLLGVHIVGAHATDMVHEAVVAIVTGCTAADLARIVHAHPTLSEAFAESAEDWLGNAIHKPLRKVANGIPV